MTKEKITEATTGAVDGPAKPLHEMSMEEFAAYRRQTLDGLIAAERRRRALAEATTPLETTTAPEVPGGALHREQLDRAAARIWQVGRD